jgi:kynurenine formamidase
VLPGSLAAVDVPNLTKADLDKWMTQVSNAGRWGKDDQMGTVNLITAAKRKKAAALVREGVAISLAHDVIMEKTPDNGSPFIHTMNATGEKPDAFTTTDTYTTNYHGFSMTHMDALCHMFYDGHMYNDFPQTLVTSEGAAKLDITAFKNGIFTRGVLMDIPRLKNVPYLEPGDAIYPEDLDAWEKKAHIKVESGDMLFIRTGRWARRADKGPWAVGRNTAGLHASSVPWLKQHDIAVLASDAISDVVPSKMDKVYLPVHELVIAGMGTPIFDNCDLEELGEKSNTLHRWEFLVSSAPLRVPTGTGSPLNPTAIF